MFKFKMMCIASAATLLLGCGSKDDGKDSADTDTDTTTTDPYVTPPDGNPLSLVGDEATLPPAALLSIWGTSSSNVYIVGSDPGDGPMVLHYDGTAWERLETGTTGDLWWVWGDGEDAVFISGAQGRVVQYTPSTGTFSESFIADPAYKFFGTWGSSATDVWTVGGDPVGNMDGVIYHFDGTDWTESATAPRGAGDAIRQAFKIWGSGPDDIWTIGTMALMMHYDGTAWTEVTAPVNDTSPLTTIAGSGDLAYAVGGFGNAIVAKLEGGTWTDDSPPPQAIAPFFNGVSVHPTHGTVACGGYGQIWWKNADGWEADPREPVSSRDLHACWIDPDGGVWAVGGDLSGLTAGSVVYGGPSSIPKISL
jgi:hypothetical protein